MFTPMNALMALVLYWAAAWLLVEGSRRQGAGGDLERFANGLIAWTYGASLPIGIAVFVLGLLTAIVGLSPGNGAAMHWGKIFMGWSTFVVAVNWVRRHLAGPEVAEPVVTIR